MVKDGQLRLNLDDEIVRSTVVTEGGEIVNPRIREFFSLPALVAQRFFHHGGTEDTEKRRNWH